MGSFSFFAKATGRSNSYFCLVISLKNYFKKIVMIIIMIIIIIIVNTVMGPCLGQSLIITAIKEEKKVKRN